MLLISRSSGRLGNQLFQLANTLNLRRHNQIVVFLGFNEAHSLIGRLAPKSIRIPVPNLFYHQAKRLFKKMKAAPTIGTVTRGTREPGQQEQRFPFIELLDEQDCHYPSVLSGNNVLHRCALVTTALAQKDDRQRCFVHIRLGDYSSFLVGGLPVEIPLAWYEAQMADVRLSNPGIAFQIFSDEPSKVRERMNLQPDTEVIDAGTNLSFAGMANCEMGILSASTFSWWAAAVAHSRGNTGPFVAPAGWESWRTGVWSNSDKLTPWLRYRQVGS
jgi:hypothetical protein